MLILGIESSCDDTAAAVLENNKVLSNVVAQQAIHEQYGGVVPELAGATLNSAMVLFPERAATSGQLLLLKMASLSSRLVVADDQRRFR